MRNLRRQPKAGFILIVSLLVLSGLMMLATIGLMRSTTELLATNRSVASQQAFHLAEAGLDAAVWEFFQSNGDFAAAEGWSTAAPCPANSTCRTLPLNGATTTITVTDPNGTQPIIDSTGLTGLATETLRLVLQRTSSLQVLSPVQIIGEDTQSLIVSFFKSGLPNKVKIDGCDGSGVPGSGCLPGIVLFTQKEYDKLASYINTTDAKAPPDGGYFGDRIRGAKGDLSSPLPNGRTFPDGDYSIHKALDVEKGTIGTDSNGNPVDNTRELYNDLASWAKTKAQDNGCYFDYLNDSVTSNDVITDPNNPKAVILDGNKTPGLKSGSILGDPNNPKVCYAEFPFSKTKPDSEGKSYYADTCGDCNVELYDTIKGAGVLVIKAELEIPAGSNILDYEGLIINIGPRTEFDVEGKVDIRGAVLTGGTEKYCSGTTTASSCDPINLKNETPELEPEGDGEIRYDRQAIDLALGLLQGWTPPGGGGQGGFEIKAWQDLE